MKILCVDDETRVTELIKELLEFDDNHVETINTSKDVIEFVKEWKPNIIISDIKMPHRNGYEIFAAANRYQENLPVILMTGFGYDPGHSIVHALQNGLHPKARLFKPFRLDQLIDVIKEEIASILTR